MGLTQSDLSSLTETLASGKHPRVVFTASAGQIAGKTGKVVRLDEPAEGDFVVVAFGNDELPFTAEEVRVPERGELNRKPKKKTPQPQTPSGPPLLNNGDQSPTQQVEEDTPVNAEPTVPPVPQQNDSAQDAPPAAKKRQPKAKSAPELTVTLAWKDDTWTVSASKGTKVIAKPVPVKATEAVEMVRSLEAPAVTEVVEDIVEQERQRATAEAEQLRQQLAAAEARLAELGES